MHDAAYADPSNAGPDGPAVGMLLDLENLLHEARRVSGEAIRHGLATVMRELRPLGAPRFVIGVCDWWLAKSLCPTAAALGVRVYPGPMGPRRADAELLRRGLQDIPGSIDIVVIGSGDRAFCRLVHAHRAAGRRVVVAGPEGAIAACLRALADDVVEVALGQPAPTAAGGVSPPHGALRQI